MWHNPISIGWELLARYLRPCVCQKLKSEGPPSRTALRPPTKATCFPARAAGRSGCTGLIEPIDMNAPFYGPCGFVPIAASRATRDSFRGDESWPLLLFVPKNCEVSPAWPRNEKRRNRHAPFLRGAGVAVMPRPRSFRFPHRTVAFPISYVHVRVPTRFAAPGTFARPGHS
jgi:hypothetical protein